LCFISGTSSLCAGGKKGKKGNVNGKKSEESDIFKLVKMIMQRNFDPVQSLLSLLQWQMSTTMADDNF